MSKFDEWWEGVTRNLAPVETVARAADRMYAKGMARLAWAAALDELADLPDEWIKDYDLPPDDDCDLGYGIGRKDSAQKLRHRIKQLSDS